MYLKLILKHLFLPNMDGILKISFFSDSELLLVVTDQLDSVWLMTTNNIWSSMNQTSDWENWQFYQKETPRESLRNNWKEKLKNPEALKREKFWPLEKLKLKVMLEKLKKNISKNLLHDDLADVYSILTFWPLFFISVKNVWWIFLSDT